MTAPMGGGPRVELEVFGDVQVRRELRAVGERAENLRPAFQLLARLFERINERQFSTQGGNSGGWAPLAASTLKRKRRKGYDLRILHEGSSGSLALRLSLTKRTARGAKRRTTADGVDFGSRLPYAGYHQRGNDNLPQRRPVELTSDDRKDWVRVVQRWIVTGELSLP